MSSLVVISMSHAERKLISYFRDKKAVSPEKSIKFDQKEYENSGPSYLRHDINPSKVPYLKLGEGNTFYLDEQLLSTYEKRNKKMGIVILSFCLVLFILVLLFDNLFS